MHNRTEYMGTNKFFCCWWEYRTLVQITSEALKNIIMTSNIWISMAFPFQHELCALSANEKWAVDENVGRYGVWSQWIFMKHFHTHKETILWCKLVKHKNKKGGKHLKEGPNQHAATAVIHTQPLRQDVFLSTDSSVMGQQRVIMYFKHPLYIRKHDHTSVNEWFGPNHIHMQHKVIVFMQRTESFLPAFIIII